jgi:hypothetical protein
MFGIFSCVHNRTPREENFWHFFVCAQSHPARNKFLAFFSAKNFFPRNMQFFLHLSNGPNKHCFKVFETHGDPLLRPQHLIRNRVYNPKTENYTHKSSKKNQPHSLSLSHLVDLKIKKRSKNGKCLFWPNNFFVFDVKPFYSHVFNFFFFKLLICF